MTRRTRFDICFAGCFSRLGACIARLPGVFIIVPLLLTLLMGSGIQQFRYISDVNYLFVPVNAKSIQDRIMLEEIFPENLTQHVLGSELRLLPSVELILVPQYPYTALSRRVWEEAAVVVEAITNISVYSEGREYSWSDLCVKYERLCVDNTFLNVLSSNVTGETMENIKYPVMRDNQSQALYPIMAHLGGVDVDDGAVIHAKALRLSFMLDDSSSHSLRAALLWVNAVHYFIEKIKLKTSDITCFSPHDVERELVDNIQTAFEENFPLIVILVSTFTIINCMSTDWVRSKPLMGIVGLLCVILSAFSGVGLCLYLGFPWQAINVVVIFLLIGIGMDGVFVMLSAWSRSEQGGRDLVTRMSITYSDASVSLSVTSLTNILSFLVGATFPGFPCVQIFCVYAGICLMFNYVLIITFFGAFLAISGHIEYSNRHCLFLMKVQSKTESENSSFLYKVFLTGGISKEDPDNPRDNKGEKLMICFKNFVTPCLEFVPTKIFIIAIFAFYIAAATFGILGMQEGLEMKNLVMKRSGVVHHFDAQETYFKDHPYRIQIAITQECDYHNELIQEQMMSLISELEQSQYVISNPLFRQSWLHEFLTVAKENFLILNITTKQQFINSLKLFLLEADQLSTDVRFNKRGNEVEASRFFLQSERMDSPHREMLMMINLRKIIRKYPFEVIVYNPYFEVFDQFIEVFDNTVMCIILCSVMMSIVILIFIPKKICVVWVTLTVMSVELGVVGLMSFWSIKLDVISMIVLIMGIGFSVDFSAHVSYHYLASEDGISPFDRLAHCLYALGPPILQAAGTTLLSVLPLFNHDSYIISTFSKLIFLIIVLGFLHSLLLLPVLLSISAPEWKKAKNHAVDGDILSPSNTMPLSETFLYKDGTDHCLVEQALTGEPKRRKYVPLDYVKKNFVNHLEDSEIEVTKDSLATNLGLSFFQPSDSDTSELVADDVVTFRNRTSRVHSDSTYYSYQKIHLRRHKIPILSSMSHMGKIIASQLEGERSFEQSITRNNIMTESYNNDDYGRTTLGIRKYFDNEGFDNSDEKTNEFSSFREMK